MGAKIFVIKLGTVIKWLAALAAVGAVVLAVSLLGGGTKATYMPGTYSANIVLNSRPVRVELTVNRHSITQLKLLNMEETQAVFYPVFEQSFDEIAAAVVEQQSTEGIALSRDNQVTGGIILDAVNAALEEAKNK